MPWYIHSIRRLYDPSCMAQVDGSKYALSVPEPYTAGRFLAAWWVMTGRAYAFEWPKPGDIETAIGMPLWDRSVPIALEPRAMTGIVERLRQGIGGPEHIVESEKVMDAAAEIERLRADRATVYEWMREPDHVEIATHDWLIDWVNRRPLAAALKDTTP